jgi:Zn finger protein HypA/HybF involved in hydrogenase expression
MSANEERVPSCLENVNAVSVSTGDPKLRAYKIGCTCGSSMQQLLGYSLESQSLPGEVVFVGPLSIECLSCGKRSLFFDSERHGHDGENESSVAMSGTGEPQQWSCPQCESSNIEVEVQMTYNVEHEKENEERAEDFFSEIAVACKCRKCKKTFKATSIDCI